MSAASSPAAGTARNPIVRAEEVTVRFESRDATVQAVNAVSFTLDPGEVLCILGESGSGKSVTLRALMRLLPPRRSVLSGRIEIGGRDVLAMSERDLADLRGTEVGMIFQEPMVAFDPVYTVGRQITETIVRHDGVDRTEARRRALDLLERVRIPSPARRLRAYPHELSGGMRQRAMIALALSCRPSLLLADEPTTALDATVQIQILLLLRELQRELGMAVIFVTHDVGVAVEIADRIAVMYGGRFVETGPVRQIMRDPRHPYTQGLLTSTVHGSLRGTLLEAIPGSPPDMTRLPAGCAFAPRWPVRRATVRISPARPRALAPPHGALRPRRVTASSEPNALAAGYRAEDDVDPGKHQFELRARDPAHALFEQRPVEGDDLRHVCHRILRQAGHPRREPHVTRSSLPPQVAGEWDADHRGNPASVQGVALHDDDRAPESGPGSGGCGQLHPAHVTLGDHHSTWTSRRRAAAARKASSCSPTSSQTRFMASVTSSCA